MKAQRVVVVGAGIGGLVTALELAAAGVEVTVLERAAQVGGKMRRVAAGGALMDAGPTVFTMRWVFDELFESIGLRLADHLTLRPLSILARHAWGPDQRLDLFADADRSADAIGDFAGAAARQGFIGFCARAGAVYRSLERPFLRASRPNPLSLATRVGWRGLPELLQIAPFTTLWDELGRHFADPRLRQLFGRYATYCGASPYLAPATLMLVAHVEQQGVWQVDGGMHRVAEVLAARAQQFGARLRLGCAVDEVLTSGGRASGVRLADGETLAADAVVFNGDVSALASGLLGAPARRAATAVRPAERSLSALIWNLLTPTAGFPLVRHGVFFSADGRAEFDDLARGRLPAAPTVYVCAQDRGDDIGSGSEPDGGPGIKSSNAFSNEPGNKFGNEFNDNGSPLPVGAAERLLLIVNAPATGDTRPFAAEALRRCEEQIFHHLRHCGLQIHPDPATTIATTPADFDALFPATGGALYGRASHGWAASFARPGARSRLPGLYLAGGSVHPGPGVPMAALSGRQAAASVLADRTRAVAISTHRAAVR